ncbi:glycerophosphodiester phosphodiesterase family protein [Desulfopila sp. IMCC35008]|uniref:glycerophosphodiester phosphodiesterase family protein n=1 Tax=Desulfopila sp. IMCC35008 TaxID=2653858 RepID=UPI0013CF956D|nr:glycerophosphodiester phosphodiesterase family protein [Desulfopila sp. IMCC35008]
MNHTVEEVWKEILLAMKHCIGQILIIHLVYIAIGLTVFTPLVGFLTRILLHISGKPMLSDLDIAYFILTPPGMISALLMGGILITIVVFEQASLMAIISNTIKGTRVTIASALLFTLNRLKTIYLFSLRLIIKILIIVLPFLVVSGGIAWLLLTEYDINYYLLEKPPVFLLAAGGIGLLLLLMVILVVQKLLSWILALPLILLTDTRPQESFAESETLTEGFKRLLLKIFLLWASIIFILQIVLVGILQISGTFLIPYVYAALPVLVLFLGGLVALYSVGNIFITTFASATFCSFLVVFSTYSGLDLTPLNADTPVNSGQVKKNFLSVPLVFLSLIFSTGVAMAVGAYLFNGIPTDNDIAIIAHRGAAGKAPENTLASIRQAIDDQADWVEIDVQESSDGQIAVIHDSDLMKIGNNPMKVWNAPLSDLKTVDVGSWFDPRYSSERIPSLREVIDVVKGKSKLLIELKYYGYDEHLEQRVIDIVEETDMIHDVAIMSLKLDGVQKASTLRPGWSFGLLSSKSIGDISNLNMDFLAVNMATTTPGFIRRVHNDGKQVYVWTVNDKISISRMTALGVDGLITDEPELARTVLAEREELNLTERLLLHTTVLLGRPIPSRQYRDQSP